MTYLKMISANCQGLRDQKKRADVLHNFVSTGVDVLCLQDTHWLTTDLPLIKNIWVGECFLNGAKTNSRGVAILISKNLGCKVSSVEKDDAGNYISLLITVSDLSFRLVNIYAPNNDSPLFFQMIKNKVIASVHDYCIICGDFNLVLNPDLDSFNYTNINNPQSRRLVLEMIDTLPFIDAF